MKATGGTQFTLCAAGWIGAFAVATAASPANELRDVLLERGVYTTELRLEEGGRLFLWAESDEVDVGLRVALSGASTATLLEDRDGGAGDAAFLEVSVEPGTVFAITVFDPTGEATRATARLHTSLAAENEESTQRVEEFRAALTYLGDLEPEQAAEELPFLFELFPSRGAELSPRQVEVLTDLRGLPTYLRTGVVDATVERLLTDYWTQHLPVAHPRKLEAQALLAASFKRNGQAGQALPLEQEVLEQRTRTLAPDDTDVLIARLNLGATLFTLGNLEAAASEFELLSARLSDRPITDPFFAAVQQNYAAVLLQRGFAAEAAAIFESLLEPHGSTLGGLAYTDVRRNLGQALIELGDTERAEGLLTRLLAEQRAALRSDDPQLLRTQLHLALALKLLGDVDAARVLEEQTLAVQQMTLPEEHPQLLLARLELADTMALARDFAAARPLLESVVEARTRSLPADHPELRTARVALAECLYDMGDAEGARTLLEQVSGFGAEHDGTDVDVLRAGELLAMVLLRLGQPDEARPVQEWVLAERTRLLPAGHPMIQSARRQLAWVALAQEQPVEALRLVDELVRDARAQVEYMAARQASRELQGLVTAGEKDLASVLSIHRLAKVERDPELETRAFELVETMRAVAATQRRRVALLERVGAAPETRAALDELTRARAAVARGTREGALFEALRRRDRAERAVMAQLLKEPEASRLGPEVSAEAIRAALRPSEAGLAFWRHRRWSLDADSRRIEPEGDHYLVFVLRPDAPLQRVELGPAAEIDAAVEAWRAALLQGRQRGVALGEAPADTELAAGRRLRQLVFDPLAAALQGVELCHLALDDALHVVPLDALPEDAPSKDAERAVIGDRMRFVVRASLKGLTSPAAPTAEPSLLTLGGVDYEGPAGTPANDGRAPTSRRMTAWEPSFSYLPATDSEVRTLAHYFQRAHPEQPLQVLTADDATRKAFEREASSASYLHLATHAYFAPESVPSMLDTPAGSEFSVLDPRDQARGLAPLLLCGLVFAGANQVGSAGEAARMTADELSGLDLSRCDLAVLSACETGIGVRRAGQGVASLQSALHAAGARSMITSLWEVPDLATGQLMAHFYRLLWVEHRSKAESLWAAKQKLRAEVEPDGRRRFSTRDWAGWVLSGEPD